MSWRYILTADEMRAAEADAIAKGNSVETLMERAGMAAAEAVRLYAGLMPTLVLCGPGNNGGDGYVIARALRERGANVRVGALGEPAGQAARAARAAWTGEVEPIDAAAGAPCLVDALFGTGLGRPLDGALAARLASLADQARVRVAIDMPSGVATDDGSILSTVPKFDLTITFASLKPSHLLLPAAEHMGRIVVADIGIVPVSALQEIGRPKLKTPEAASHKYDRGYAAILAGEMAGAAALTASASLRAGAGYVRLIGGPQQTRIPRAIVQSDEVPATVLDDRRIGALAVGPGLGKGKGAQALLDLALSTDIPLVLDADALTLLAADAMGVLRERSDVPILTPHGGEFWRLFPDCSGSKIERARQAAAVAGSIIVYKGADTVVAEPEGRAAISSSTSHWLATAGTGDVLTGIIAAMRAGGLASFEAACAGVWLHGRAAELAGPVLIADDLVESLPDAVSDCL